MKSPWLLAVLSVLVLQSCDLFNTEQVHGSGVVTSESRSVSGISEMQLNGTGDANIVSGNTEALVIEAEDNIIPYLTTEIKDNRLVIGTRNFVSLHPTKPIRYTIIVKDIDSAELNGSGNISLPGINAASVSLTINGSGSINITGSTVSLNATIAGSGSINAGDLQSLYTHAVISGSGNITTWSLDSLNSVISGSGDVNYYGSPSLSTTITGSGSVRRIGSK